MVYSAISGRKQKGIKQLAVLIDPDKSGEAEINSLIEKSLEAGVDYFFTGGSLMISNRLDKTIRLIKEKCNIPVVLFPGSPLQISLYADSILFLSLISGRNPELLIGHHVISAPVLKKSNLEVISTGYMLIDGGKATTASYISASQPIPYDKADIAMSTAVAGEMLGMKLIYLDTGSGAEKPVSCSMIKEVSDNINVPVIAGGGIKTPDQASRLCEAGADVIVIGNITEKDPSLILEIANAVKRVTDETYNHIQSGKI